MKRYFLLFPILLIGIFSSAWLTAEDKIEQRIVKGNSLSPLIKPGDKVRIYFSYYLEHEIQRGDIVVLEHPGHSNPIIKIIKCIPKDRFELKESEDGAFNILLNGKVLKNSSNQAYKFSKNRKRMLSLYQEDYGGIIPEDTYLLLGDKASGSLDASRFGLIDKKEILGKVELVN